MVFETAELTGNEQFSGKLTTNKLGSMYEYIEEFTAYGIKLIEAKSNPTVMDVGCAYGFVSKTLLSNEKNQNIKVIANDIGQDHLEDLKSSLADQPDKLNRLETRLGNIMNHEFAKESIDGIIALKMIHFLTGPEVRQLFAKFYEWMRPGGCLVISASSPFNWTFERDFWPTYKERLAEGEEWPGEITSEELKSYIISPKVIDMLPERLTVFTVEDLVREATKAGFNVLRTGYVNRMSSQNYTPVYRLKNHYACLVAVKGMFE